MGHNRAIFVIIVNDLCSILKIMAFLRRIWSKWQNLLHDEKLKHKIYVIIFESDTPMGKLFDVALIGFIVLSILVVIAESIKSWDTVIGPYLRVSEYVFTFFLR